VKRKKTEKFTEVVWRVGGEKEPVNSRGPAKKGWFKTGTIGSRWGGKWVLWKRERR